MSLIAFPLERRRELVRRLAAQMLARSSEQGEKHLATQLRRQTAALMRKGLPDGVVQREVQSLIAAVRREIWRIVLRVPPPSKDGQRDTST